MSDALARRLGPAGPVSRSRSLRARLALALAWREPERQPLAIALVAALLSAGAFARIAEDYLTNDPLARWDVSFASWLFDARSSAGIDVFRVVTLLGSPAVVLALAAVLCVTLYGRRRLDEAALVVVVLGGAQLLNLGLKLAFHRPRPEVALVQLDTYSFPSGHAMIATVACGVFVYLLWGHLPSRRTRVLVAAGFGAVAALIGFSRLYLGVHYLSDVLGGIAAGVTWLSVSIALRLAFAGRLATRRMAVDRPDQSS